MEVVEGLGTFLPSAVFIRSSYDNAADAELLLLLLVFTKLLWLENDVGGVG